MVRYPKSYQVLKLSGLTTLTIFVGIVAPFATTTLTIQLSTDSHLISF
mgnify:CR=1 FL=1|jgi:hypothetical protein